MKSKDKQSAGGFLSISDAYVSAPIAELKDYFSNLYFLQDIASSCFTPDSGQNAVAFASGNHLVLAHSVVKDVLLDKDHTIGKIMYKYMAKRLYMLEHLAVAPDQSVGTVFPTQPANQWGHGKTLLFDVLKILSK